MSGFGTIWISRGADDVPVFDHPEPQTHSTSLRCCQDHQATSEVISGFQGIFAVTTMLFEMPADWVAMVPGVTHYQECIGFRFSRPS